MNILVAYATYSGGTQSASEFLTDKLKAAGHTVELKQISEVKFEDILSYDLRIFASPSWDNEGKEGQPHEDFITFFKNSTGKNFTEKAVAIMGLGDSSYTHFCGAVDHIEEFVKNSGGKLMVPSLKIDGYLFNMDENNKKITEWIANIK